MRETKTETQILDSELPGNPEVAVFGYGRFTEASRRDLTEEVWRLHADNYYRAGYITKEGITEEGFIDSSIYTYHGENVEYLASFDEADGHVIAALRRVYLNGYETVKDHFAYQVCGKGIATQDLDFLEERHRNSQEVVEVSGLVKEKGSSPLAVIELYRNAIQDSIVKNELWIMGITASAHRTLRKQFGDRIIQVIGDPQKINDSRIREGVTLTPAVIEPQNFVDNLLINYKECHERNDYKGKHEALNLFLSFSDGIDEYLSPSARRAKEMICAGVDPARE